MPDDSGKQNAITMISQLMTKMPQLIRDDKKYQIEKNKFKDNEEALNMYYSQFQNIYGELGLDTSTIQKPQTEQDSDEYLTQSMSTFLATAKSQNIDETDIMKSAQKIAGGAADPTVMGMQEHATQKQATMDKVFGVDPGVTQRGGGILSPTGHDPATGEGGFVPTGRYQPQEQDTLSIMLNQPSPYEMEEQAMQTINPITGEQEQPLEKGKVSERINPLSSISNELNKSLMLLPRAQRSIVYQKMFNDKEKFYETQALAEVNKYLEVKRKNKELMEKEGRTERSTERTRVATAGTAEKVRKATAGTAEEVKFRSDAIAASKEGRLMFGGEKVEYYDRSLPWEEYQILNKPYEPGYKYLRRGGGAGADSKLLSQFMTNRQRLHAELAKLDKLLADPEALLTAEEFSEYGGDITKAQERQDKIIDEMSTLDYDINQLRGKAGLKDKPEEKKGSPKMSAEDEQAYNWAQANPDDPRAQQILDKLKNTYDF